jgi:hypothetical protein
MTGLLTAGCLQKDVTQTWYVEPDGQVQWVIQESNVRSDAQAAGDRQREEESYLGAVQLQDHPIARGFRELGLTTVRTRLLRSSAPFTVMTDARAPQLDVLGRRLILGLGLEGSSVLERQGDAWQWTMTVRDPHADDKPGAEDVMSLVDRLESLRVVLATGSFEDAAGFTIGPDRRVASLEDLDRQTMNRPDNDPMILLRLKWR